MALGTIYTPILVNGRNIMIEEKTAERLGIAPNNPNNRSIMPDEVGFHDGDIGSLVMQGVEPSEFKVPKFRLAAEYAQAHELVRKNQGLRTGILYVEGQ